MKRNAAPDGTIVLSGALLWALAVSWAKIVQAANLQNQAFDLGILANTLWNTAHGAWFRDAVKGVHYLGDHFSPGLALLAPLLRLWPDAAALSVAQSFALAAAIPAIHRLAWIKTNDRSLSAAFTFAFAASPLLHDASRYDVHAAAFAVPLLCWAICLYAEGRDTTAVVLLALAGTLQEDLWLCAAAISFHAGQKRMSFWFIFSFAIALLGIKAFGGGYRPNHWAFYSLNNFSFSVINRSEGILRLLLPLGLLPLFAGRDAFPLLVPFLYTWIGSNPHQQRVDMHYGAVMLPFLFLAAISGAVVVKTRVPRLALILVLLSLATYPFQKRYFHSVPPERVAAMKELSALVPPDAPVWASFNLVPALALRSEARMWRDGEETPGAWTALDRNPVGFGPSPARDEAIRRFVVPRAARVVFAKEDLVLLAPEPIAKMKP